VFENRAQRKIFVSKRYDVKGDREDYVTKSLYDLYSSTNTIRALKSKRMRWEGYVARMGGERRCIQGFAGET
jgi:hypothetical protein